MPVSGSEILKLISSKKEISINPEEIVHKDIKDDYISEVVENIKINSNR